MVEFHDAPDEWMEVDEAMEEHSTLKHIAKNLKKE